ncbi:MAG TPA: CRTAC1 family protein [Candidatus Acidoferrales bacterium]|nr:CRTAC1 family protein [Candidatus Acidoferrales bacterium]
MASMVVSDAPAPGVSFEDISARSGIDAVLHNGATPEKHQIETMAGGVAAFDFDGDGLVDIFVTNGARQPDLTKPDAGWWNRLYRNRGGGRFEDVTARSGLRGAGFSMGAAAADYDNDGRPDLFVAGVKGNHLYRNRGRGVFEDVTEKAGIHGEPWSVAGGWFDYDGDGRLDLFVVNYVDWNPAKEPACVDPGSGQRAHCHPRFYQGLPNTLYHNNGNGTFTDVSEAAGIRQHVGKGMGVAFADYDGDGRPDIFVTNDGEPNFLFHNDGNGHFTEVGVRAGVALNDDGRALSSMGVDFRDIDNDGRPDVFLTALVNETYPVYRNLGKGLFADFTYRSRVGAATAQTTGWGNGIYDFNNDGRKDLFSANGDLNDNAEALSGRASRQTNLVLAQLEPGTFEPVPVGPPARYRGAAFADLDNDGRVDAVVARLGEAPLVLLNTSARESHWLGLKLVGRRGNRDGIGAVVHVKTAAGEQWNQVTTAVGFASSSDVRVHFGLGAARRATLDIRWPHGTVQQVGVVVADRYLTVREP